MADAPARTSDDVAGADVPEVSNIHLVKFLSSDHPAIAQAARRVLLEAEQNRDNYAAHGSSPVSRSTNAAEPSGLGRR